MFSSPRRRWLYRTSVLGVTLLAGVVMWAQGTIAQYGRKGNAKGPRALGLVQLFPNGKAHLIPVAIMVDGKFYDAASYKGTPVPMALDFGVVYEGFRSGVSQGLFTVTQPGQAGHNWMAEGTWLPAGTKPPQKALKYEAPNIEDSDAPPRLQRGGSKPAAPQADKPAAQGPVPAKTEETAKVAEPESSINDPNRPILRRGKPDPSVRRELVKNFDQGEKPAKSGQNPAAAQLIPAISDAGGPEARTYAFEMKPGEEAQYRTKILALAGDQLRGKPSMPPVGSSGRRPAEKAMTTRKVAPAFDDVHLRVFDLSNANEPILVLSATTRPAASATEGEEITVVARTNLEGEMQKLFFSKTDSRSLYVAPRMELIDAVDADGDGRGELLFRTTSDAGSSYRIYRVTADKLYLLYEGTR